MLKTITTLVKNIFFGKKAVLGLFIVALPFLVFVVAKSSHDIIHLVLVKWEMPRIEKNLSREMDIALRQTQAAVNEHAIDGFIESGDASNTAVILRSLAEKYALTTMVAVNKEGIAQARVPSPRIGDYVFQTTPWGRSAASGEATTTIGVGRNFPLIINSAVPIFKNKELTGALFGGYLLDDNYARIFKEKYLGSGENIIFYSDVTGPYGMNFADPEVRQLLYTYINQGSGMVKQSPSGLLTGHIQIDREVFHVLNIRFTDFSATAGGGMLILVPINTWPTYLVALLGGLLVALLIIEAQRRRRRKNLRNVGVAAIVMLAAVIGNLLLVALIINWQIYKLNEPGSTIYNSTIAFAPDSDIFLLSTPQRIAIQITAGGESINAARAVIQFDPRALRVDEIAMENSFCGQGFVLEKRIDNQNGTITVACGKPNGFMENRAIIADLVVQPLKTGNATLVFGTGTLVLANDGLGTNVLRALTNASYRIIAPAAAKRSNEVILFSNSHPNQSRWYNQKNIHIDWSRPDSDTEYLYAFNRDAATIPTGERVTKKTGIDLTAESDGIYYFHIAPRKAGRVGQTSHYKFMIDATPPNTPEIRQSATTVHADELVRFEFLSHGDAMSGVQKNFYLQSNGGTWFPTLPSLYIPFARGKYTIRVRVFDNAGNFSDANSIITAR